MSPIFRVKNSRAARHDRQSFRSETMSGKTLDKLQELSLISKICTELDSYLGLSDKTLAEFIIHLADTHDNANSFRVALNENGADFPASLSDNLFRIIRAMKPAVSFFLGSSSISIVVCVCVNITSTYYY